MSPISVSLTGPFASTTLLADGPLGVSLDCGIDAPPGPNTAITIRNSGSQPATLNWFYSDGTAVHAAGAALGAGGAQVFDFGGKRLEGQFIFYESDQVWTLNLHAIDQLVSALR